MRSLTQSLSSRASELYDSHTLSISISSINGGKVPFKFYKKEMTWEKVPFFSFFSNWAKSSG
jgi:hypothetical protein